VRGVVDASGQREPAHELALGALVAVRRAGAPARPALVAGIDEGTVVLHLSAAAGYGPAEPLTVSWSMDGRILELEARVLACEPEGQDVTLSWGAPAQRVDERRGVDRFPLVAEALLVIGDEEFVGRSSDVSVLGCGLSLPAPGPDAGALGELLLHDAGEALIPGVPVRVAFREERGARVQVGVEFADAGRVADATVALLTAIERY
jgi:hypothetical protein